MSLAGMDETRQDELASANLAGDPSPPPRPPSHWPFLIFFALVAFAVVTFFGNLPIALFMVAGLAIVLRFAFRTFLRPYMRAQRMRRARDARAFRDAANPPRS